MARLKFYRVGWKKHAVAFATKIPEDRLPMIHQKICRHFKLRCALLAKINKDGGVAHLQTYTISVGKNTSFGVLCHELAHIYNYRRWGKKATKHGKKLAKTIDRFVKYCEKKNYWGLVSQTSTSPTAGQSCPDSQSPISDP